MTFFSGIYFDIYFDRNSLAKFGRFLLKSVNFDRDYLRYKCKYFWIKLQNVSNVSNIY